jgi:hypothetical protein
MTEEGGFQPETRVKGISDLKDPFLAAHAGCLRHTSAEP